MNNNIAAQDRLIVALDFPSAASARVLVRTLDDAVNFYKVGMELFTSPGVFGLIDLLKQMNKKIFIDLKYYDIPETVYKASKGLVELGVDFMTVHSTPQTINAAVRATQGTKTDVLAVTVLTSIDHHELEAMGLVDTTIDDLVIARTTYAMKEGASGIVCSGQEAKLLREQFGDDVGYIVTPGIRPVNTPNDDQKRVVTVKDAIMNGSDYLVIGRPIRDSKVPKETAENIQRLILQALYI